MMDKEMTSISDMPLPENWVRWAAITLCVGFISWAVAESIESKYKAETGVAVVAAWSKVVVACIEQQSETDCGKKYKTEIRF